jgi:hypothetical protein
MNLHCWAFLYCFCVLLRNQAVDELTKSPRVTITFPYHNPHKPYSQATHQTTQTSANILSQFACVPPESHSGVVQ